MAKVDFIEDGHIYRDETGKQYTSVTTVIGKYKQPFDTEYWLLYKAIQRIVINKYGEGFFNKSKKQAGGYEFIIPYFLPKIQTPNLLQNTIEEIREEWRIKKEEACAKGTSFHKKKEDETNSVLICPATGLIPIPIGNRSFEKPKDGIYAEHVVWNEEYGIAGQADKDTIENGYVDIDDYKTSKVIEEKSFYHYIRGHTMMKEPVNNLMDCNLSHYTLQLSTYGWMLEQKGLKVRRLRIYHTIKDKWIEVPYLKNEVVKMLNHFTGKHG